VITERLKFEKVEEKKLIIVENIKRDLNILWLINWHA